LEELADADRSLKFVRIAVELYGHGSREESYHSGI